jgi:hypothetical protein
LVSFGDVSKYERFHGLRRTKFFCKTRHWFGLGFIFSITTTTTTTTTTLHLHATSTSQLTTHFFHTEHTTHSSSWSTDTYACSLISFFFAVIVFRVDGGRPSHLATSILFSDGFFSTSSMMRSHSSKVQTCMTGNAIWEKKFIKR